ncbi:MAG: glycerophosphodiester phosphodiesterase [Tidjanibacter sp.]|nr:glycerophosphodiester phosphodiesterase [Tidjanibacter sp.]
MTNLIKTAALSFVVLAGFNSCESQDVTNTDRDAARIELGYISEDMAKVRDYVPDMAVIAHRGSVYWVPEETEAAWRWAREMGADYLEADLQCSKDGVILANHDDNLRRTTNIENVFGETVPESRLEFYMSPVGGGMSLEAAQEQMKKDRASFNPYYTNQYFYHELAQLDAGTWFNEESMPEQARENFSKIQQYVSPLEDLIKYAEGYKLDRDVFGERKFEIKGVWDPANPHTCLTYEFKYVKDDVDAGHRPGIYLEFKESWLNPSNFEEMVYNELKRLGWNIIEEPEPENTPFWVDGKVNVGNTNGKVILQTFSFESLRRTAEKYEGKIPMCFLLWHDQITPAQYAGYINMGLEFKAHIIGPSIAGAPNNYFEMNSPWMHGMIRRAGMLNHPYSFDTLEQMNVYFGAYHYGDSDFEAPYMDGAFTNRTEITLQYFIDKGVRDKNAAQTVPNPVEVLERLGY